MAYTNETKILKFNVAYAKTTGVSKTASNTVTLAMNESNDSKYVFEVVVSTAGTLTVEGNSGYEHGVYGLADLAFGTLTVGTHYFALDSAKYKQLSGTDKGKVSFSGTMVGTISAIVLP